MYSVIKQIADRMSSKRYQERDCACGYQKLERQSVHVNSLLQISCISNESAVKCLTHRFSKWGPRTPREWKSWCLGVCQVTKNWRN